MGTRRATGIAIASLFASLFASGLCVVQAPPARADPVLTPITTTETRISKNPADEFDPAISEDRIVYTSNRTGDDDVWYYDISTGLEADISPESGDQELGDASGDTIVYTDLASQDIIAYSISSRTKVDLTQGVPAISTYPSVSDRLVTWQDNRAGNYDIYVHDLTTGEERALTTAPAQDQRPAVSGSTIVWQRCTTGVCDIFAYDWTTGLTRQITDSPTISEINPHVSGSTVVYEASRNGDTDIYAYDLATGAQRQLAFPGTQTNAHVSGTSVTFEDLADGGNTYHIRLWDLVSGALFDITRGMGSQFLNAIDGNRIVYTDDRDSQLDIYMTEFTITRDTTPPAIVPTVVGAKYDGFEPWRASFEVTVDWDVSDPSGIVSTTGCDPWRSTISEITTLTCTATDGAGNTGSASVAVYHDATPPTIVAKRSVEPNADGWNNVPVTVSFTCTDDFAGLRWTNLPAGLARVTCDPWTIAGETNADVWTFAQVYDNAGNFSSLSVGPIRVDLTPPVTSITGVTDGADYAAGSVPPVGCTSLDALSGLTAEARLSVSGGPLGSVTATCSGATDKAGNVGQVARVTYNVHAASFPWTGFFQPVDNMPTLNLAKAGSAIPVKFSLGGDHGLAIAAAGYPKSGSIVCSTGVATDDIEATVNAGSSSLSYDSATGQYTYVWKTDKAWVGSCRSLTLRLSDGTDHVAAFKFAK